jgi:hypothetical protein
MILKCGLCGRKVSTEMTGTLRGKVICNTCWDSSIKPYLKPTQVSRHKYLFCPDKDTSESQTQDLSCIAKAIHSKSSVQHSEVSSFSRQKSTCWPGKKRRKTYREYKEETHANSQKIREAQSKRGPIKPKKQKKEITPISCPKVVEEIINFWNTLGLHNAQPGTKVYNENIRQVKRAMRGKLSCAEGRKFSKEEIVKAITNFHLAATHPDYHPPESKYKKSLAKTPLAYFVYSNFSSRSYLMEYLKAPKKVEEREHPEDKYPNLTKYYANFYLTQVLGGIKPKNGISQYDMIHFVRAAERTAEFYKEHEDKMELRGAGIYSLLQFGELVTEALEHSVNGDLHKLTPGWFSSDAMFDKRLPAFLYANSIIEDRRDL